MEGKGPLGASASLEAPFDDVTFYDLHSLEASGHDTSRLPYSIRVMLESMMRRRDDVVVTADDIDAVASWPVSVGRDVPFVPARVILQDFTGVPAVVDLASMRSAMAREGGDPSLINPIVPADLVIDHSVQTDLAGTCLAREANEAIEMLRNGERYSLLRWAQGAFDNFRVVPPGNGIIHQVNLERLAPLVHVSEGVAYPDSVFGTDSHTTQINGLGVLGWGVGGIEAEAVMLGQPYFMPIPEVIGVRLTGRMGEGITATDLVLTVVEMLRAEGVVGKFVEFFGPGLDALDIPDRATLSNMAPEYGATMGFFPVDERTLEYMVESGRDPDHVALVETYVRANGLYYDGEPEYTKVLEFDMGTVVQSLAGHKRPQDRIPLAGMRDSFTSLMDSMGRERRNAGHLADGSVVIASITSCTNTSNPSVMMAAALLARNAVLRGLRSKPWVKTSLSPGSRVVTDYLETAGLMPYLEALGFHLTGYGCMTCIGNSGPLRDDVARAIDENDLVAAAVVSANRNFEGRVHAQVRANYLASPPLVVAFAIAGRVDVDLANEPLGQDPNGEDVYLSDIWPSDEEVRSMVEESVDPSMFTERYGSVFEGSDLWDAIEVPEGDLFDWDDGSTYIRNPPFFDSLVRPDGIPDVEGARALAMLGDSITTDHISPAGAFPEDGPAGRYLVENGVSPSDFNSYGSRRGNHEVMMRGTFGNIRLRNALVPGTEGGLTTYMPTGEVMSIFEAAELYEDDDVPLILLAGKEYGTGSSRDWAAKGPQLLGVRAVIAESFERIHRSNLVGMGIVPLQFKDDESAESLGLDGTETFDVDLKDVDVGSRVHVTARRDDATIAFDVVARIDAPVELDYLRDGGILRTVLIDRL